MREKIVTTVIKRDNTEELFDFEKIKIAITKSADRVNYKFTQKEYDKIKSLIDIEMKGLDKCNIDFVHGVVENVLNYINKNVASSYMNYRNYKNDDLKLFQDVEKDFLEAIDGDGDNENSNTNLRHNATKRTEGAKRFSKELYKKLYLNVDEKEAMKQGYIYANDLSDLIIKGYNCALTRVGEILKNGFTLEGYEYTEPKDIDVAVGQTSDIIREVSGQHYGGLTVPQIDKILAKYYKMNYELLKKEAEEDYGLDMTNKDNIKMIKSKNYRKLCQNLQGLEMSIQTLGSSRGSYPFVTFTFGDVEDEWEADIGKAILEVRMKGHGSKVKKRCIFPKLVFLHDDTLHGEGKEYEWLYDLAIECSSKSMYPDYIDSKFFKHEGKWVSPMGCRAYLSDWWDENGEIQFEGRVNLGVVSLNLPMILMKSRQEKTDFYDTLNYYLEMIRSMHKRRFEYVGKARADSNPLMFTQGGALGGYLKPHEKIAPLLKSATISFGITALNELQNLYNGKSLKDDNTFAVEVMEYINEYVNRIKKEDDILYAIYGTPAESLCGTQLRQFRDKYGVVEGVSDREYFSNSFHLHVSEEITPLEKQDKELKLFKLFSGGRIQYGRIGKPDNKRAVKNFINRGLQLGFYQGINFNDCTCEDCGTYFFHNDEIAVCPTCDSMNVTEVIRLNGYMGWKQKCGITTINSAKLAENKDRKSM